MMPWLSLCLRPSDSLRRQLLVSFGLPAFLTLSIVATVACVMSNASGKLVTDSAGDLLRQQVVRRVVQNSLYVAETVMSYKQSIDGMVHLVSNFVEDRVVGYPDIGWEDDLYVPFVDRETGQNSYPLKCYELKMDWNIDSNINWQNAVEHLRDERLKRYPMGVETEAEFSSNLPPLSSDPSYFMQGVCDPSVTEPSDILYLNNCTAANNDPDTGGVIQPTTTNKGLYKKSADIGAFLKPIYESLVDVHMSGMYFHNSGAGSMVNYPGTVWSVFTEPYVSVGCEWMRAVNSRTGRPFATEEEISRCRPAGTQVDARLYNPVERFWYRDIALAQGNMLWGRPYNNTRGGLTFVAAGQAVFDRRTGNFIGVASFSVLLDDAERMLDRSKIHEASSVAVVNYVDGSVFIDTAGKHDDLAPKVFDTGIISEADYATISRIENFWDGDWSSSEAIRKSLEKLVMFGDKNAYTALPVPLPPPEFDPDYKPEYLVVHAIKNDAFQSSSVMIGREIQREVRRVWVLSVALAALGVMVVFGIVWYVSRGLTRPLQWMESVAWTIVNHADERAGEQLNLKNIKEPKVAGRCVLRTEISQLVSEFQSMISGFSGQGAAQVAQAEIFEVANLMTWQSDYQQLYTHAFKPERRNSLQFVSSIHDNQTKYTSSRDIKDTQLQGKTEPDRDGALQDTTSAEKFAVPVVPAPKKKNIGHNRVKNRGAEIYGIETGRIDPSGRRAFWYRSSLFWWIMVLIVAPMVLTNICIITIVSRRISSSVDYWVHDVAEKESLSLEILALTSAATLKATQAEIIIGTIAADIHLLNRFAGWFTFGGLERADSFTHVEETTQECRGYDFQDTDNTCPIFLNETRTPCACDWHDITGLQCTDINYTDPRALQDTFFFVQARDYENSTGRRDEALSFGPGVDSSPSTTLWWDDIDAVPGNEKGANASGFETTYDRIRVTSAMSAISIPVYNYLPGPGTTYQPKHFLSVFVSFEADGMMTGYSGCNYRHSFASLFVSNEENRAYEIAPKLCPRGKYGFDARCRDWYTKGKNLYELYTQPLYVTSPYSFAFDDRFAASATSPIANPATGEYAGQTLLDFSPHELNLMFAGLAESLAFLITPQDDATGSDTVVGPGFNTWEPRAISDLLFRNEERSSPNRIFFQEGILKRMKRGESGLDNFQRTNDDGSIETITIAFVPVNVIGQIPLDPSDFSRGTNTSSLQIYSVGIAYSERDIRLPWENVESEISSTLLKLRRTYSWIVICISVLFIAFTCLISAKVTEPVSALLQIVRDINSGTLVDDLPPLPEGSRESQRVYNSFAKLYKIISISNDLCFSGNLEWAHSIMKDALTLFRKVEDEKAIGIVCNNIANTLHIMCSCVKYEDECCCMIEHLCTVKESFQHYNESVSIAQHEFDSAGDNEKAEFAQQLADRLFNRGLFLLLIAGDKCAPLDARSGGLADIARVRHLDSDVRDFWIEHQLLLKESDVYFYRLIQRTLGLFQFYQDPEVAAVWDVFELVEDADRFLYVAWNQPSAPLFDHLSHVARLQQLESLAMLVDMSKGRNTEAASLAMRMFVEDEYILESAFKVAASVLLSIIRDPDDWPYSWSDKTKTSVKSDLRKMLRTCKQTYLDVGKCLVVGIELHERWEGDTLLELVNANLLKLYDDCCLNDDHMGLVANNTSVPLTLKAENEGLQRTSLDLGTSSMSEGYFPVFSTAIQILVDSVAPTQVDSFVLVLVDGFSWDSSAYVTLKAQIENMNRERETKIHVLIFGMRVANDVRESCQMLCSISKKSMYRDIDVSNVDKVFENVCTMIRGNSALEFGTAGLIMERF